VTRKDVKHVHLSVHPPDGRVTLVAPTGTRLEVARAYAISKLGWIRTSRRNCGAGPGDAAPVRRAREPLPVGAALPAYPCVEREAKPSVTLDHRRITLTRSPRQRSAKREAVMHDWHKRAAA
jgi:predicted metal-dependent hydrolase